MPARADSLHSNARAVSYVIISPVRNEARHLSRTIESVARQTILPTRWIIVDDGSTDGTRELASEAAVRYSWILVVARPDRGSRKSGSGVMEAFYDGLKRLDSSAWEYLVKLDGDLEFEPVFFEEIFRAFSREPALGISGGDIYHFEADQKVIESQNDPDFHVRGATKVYRRACWEAIGGLVPATGWDTLDEVKANMVGWRTARVSSAPALHLRPTGAADGGWRNAFKNGRGSYISGYHPVYMLSKCVKRVFERPVLIQSLGLAAGFFSSYFGGVEQIKDRDLIRYLRSQQMKRLLGQRSIWR
jgi:glycosyltransferase involved in cell wall biosynthesis